MKNREALICVRRRASKKNSPCPDLLRFLIQVNSPAFCFTYNHPRFPPSATVLIARDNVIPLNLKTAFGTAKNTKRHEKQRVKAKQIFTGQVE